jgi:hypothetical protein
MATRFTRIAVTKDPALADALDRVAPFMDSAKPAATLVHDLAIRGADSLMEEKRDRAAQLAWVAEATTSPNPPWDREVLERIDELAWGIPPETE